VRRYFRRGGATLDVGCGSGRDTAWLVANGYPAIGVDPVEALLVEARRRHPEVRFATGALPELGGLGAGAYANVLCETVIMHLDPPQARAAVERLAELLAPGGTLYLSWRVTRGGDRRDEHGRLYAAFEPQLVSGALPGLELLVDEQVTSASSGKVTRRIVARKPE
jgi:2-polyprenyl-3-methyl-5-hydroxy-6-metoxy-1,4-benzoquinol methylase